MRYWPTFFAFALLLPWWRMAYAQNLDGGFWSVLLKVDNIAIIVLVLTNLGTGYLYKTERSENREDRKTLMELFKGYNDTLNSIKNVISSITGKPLS